MSPDNFSSVYSVQLTPKARIRYIAGIFLAAVALITGVTSVAPAPEGAQANAYGVTVYHWVRSDRQYLITSPNWGSPLRYIPRGWNSYLVGQRSFFLPIGCYAWFDVAGEGGTRVTGGGYWHWLPNWGKETATLVCA